MSVLENTLGRKTQVYPVRCKYPGQRTGCGRHRAGLLYTDVGTEVRGLFPCGPDNVPGILAEADKMIAALEASGPSQKDLDKVKKARAEKRKESLKTNEYWAANLEYLQLWNYSKERFLNMDPIISELGVNDIKATANKLFDGKNSLTGILYPEATGTEQPPPSKSK